MVQTMEVSQGDEPLAGSNTNEDDEKQLLNKLVRSWKSYRDRGLNVRHELGALLNGHLGLPTKRQPLGESVLKKAAQRLSVSESELSRMRWLAHLFEDVSSLKRQQPKCHSWTDFKRMLPQLKPTNDSTAAVRSVASSQHPLRGVVKSIDRLVTRFDHMDESSEVERCKELLDELKMAVKSCEDHTTVQVKAERRDIEAKASEPVPAIPA
jgi:hypothetical protein